MNGHIYAIIDSNNGKLFPKTHLFVLRNDIEAIYTFINFGSVLGTRELQLLEVGFTDDFTHFNFYENNRLLCDFTGIPDYISTLDFTSSIDLSAKQLLSSYNFALNHCLLLEERAGILMDISQRLDSFDPKELEAKKARLAYINDTIFGGKKHERANQPE